jgi:8-oxo-dGTP pyrophosphatase MutT (NUDIX family)
MLHPADLRALLRGSLDPEPVVTPEPGERLAAVLALLVGSRAVAGPWLDPSLLFTVRATGLSRHAGEVSFPGGLVDLGETPAHAALRETHEELGVDPSLSDLLGTLVPVHTRVSDILVVPFVGMIPELPALTVSDAEIDEVVIVPVRRLASVEAPMTLDRGDGTRWHGWRYEVDGHTIWGVTGWILHALLEIVRKEAPWVTTGTA